VRILICDDHLLLAEALGAVLRSRGHEALPPASTPEAAVSCVIDQEVDVCVMDLGFPGADGLDGIRRVRSASPRTRVVALSASPDPGWIQKSRGAGANACVAKGDATHRILRAIEEGDPGSDVPRGWETSGTKQASPNPTPEGELIRFLTPREREVLERLVAGQTTSRIAREMHVHYSTARTHIQNVLTKLGVHSKLAAVTFAVRNGVNPASDFRSGESATASGR